MANEFPRGIEVLCGAIIQHDSKILLCESPKWGNKWAFPGGHIEPGETISQAAIREGKEETGLDLEFVDISGYGELINPPEFHRTMHAVYFDVVLEAKSDNITLQKEELTDWKWVAVDEALAMNIISIDRVSLEKYKIWKKKHETV